ncbi:hypothetical protein F5Y05DRAFT_396423 [Hypoxylon sp. FL0543]|nr:hypothetical protein F5Y05DRAFT_396423 [Hypoxylon sp. FL0543]
MARPSANTWWQRNHLQSWKYPEMPTKKELIYRVFRAAYPHGAFVDDDLKLVEPRNKDQVWSALEVEFSKADKDLDAFLERLFAEEPRLRGDGEKQQVVSEYYTSLLSSARYALYISQNGRFFEFRSMEELLVRYKQADEKMLARNLSPIAPFTMAGAFGFAIEHLESEDDSKVRYLQRRIKALEEKGQRT